MYISYIRDRQDLGFMCLRDKEAGDQVTVILVTGFICITIYLNSIWFVNDQDLVDRSYSNRPSRERISNQELNSLYGSHNSGKIIQTGNGTILEFQQEISATSSNDMDEIILVKDDGILPGADGFPLNNNLRRRHPFGRPRMRGRGINIDPLQNIQGLGNVPEGPKVRSFTLVDTGLNAQRGNRRDQCPVPEFDMKKQYENFMQEISEKGYKLECSQERFNEPKS